MFVGVHVETSLRLLLGPVIEVDPTGSKHVVFPEILLRFDRKSPQDLLLETAVPLPCLLVVDVGGGGGLLG